jgi:RNA polymerase sigma-70 factor (ECF subfamily)
VPDPTQQLYEQTLVVRCQIGDEAAFRELLAIHGPQLHFFVFKMTQSMPSQTEDIIQEIWVSIFRGLPSLREVGKFRPWAFRIARDRIYREYRRRKLKLQPLDEIDLHDLPKVEEPEVPIRSEELQRGLDLLPPEQREVLTLRYFAEMSYEEISHATGLAPGTVRSRLHYAKLSLKNLLERKEP